MERNSEELVSQLSYEIVKEVAPDELDLFDDFKEEFFKNPDALLEKDPKKREEMLGFALPPGAEQFITVVVVPVVVGIIDKYVIKKYITKEGKGKPSPDKINTLRDEAYNNAISAVEEAALRLMRDPSYEGQGQGEGDPLSFSDGDVTIEITDISENEKQITVSFGWCH